MRFFVIVCLLFVIATTDVFSRQDDEWFQGRPIRDIVFAGLRNVRASELDVIMSPFRGQIFTDDLFWEIQGRLWALEYFDQIEPSALRFDAAGSEVIIRFAVVERPVVTRINFSGNSNMRRTELLNAVSSRVNDVVNLPRIRADEQAIISAYLGRGFPDVQVRSETQSAGDAGVIVTFHITEGEMISIREFRFEGNTAFSARQLRGQLSLRARSFINDGAFQEARLLADREAIARFYHDRGFIDAAVIDVVRELERDERGNNNLILTFRIHEGRQYTFGGVTFGGNRIFSTAQLSGLISSRVGDVVNARRLENDLQRIADLYFEHGYIFNTIGRIENRDAANAVFSVHVPIVERGRAHIENIVIIGNERTRTDVILREIPLVPGSVFSRGKVMEGLRNLHNLQFFSMVVPETPPGSVDSLMDLVFVVEEQPTTDIQFGLTFSGSADPESFPVSGMVQWNDRNLRGSGNQLGVSLSVSPSRAGISGPIGTTSFSVNYLHRWIFGLPLSAGIDFSVHHMQRLATMNNNAPFFHGDEPYAFPDGFFSFREFIQNNRLPPRDYLMEYQQLFLSLGFSTGYRWSTFLGTLSLGGGVRLGLIRNSFDADLFRPFDPVLRDRNNQFVPRNILWTSISLDRRDIFFDPARGYLLSARMALHGVLPNEREHFMRSDLRAEQYFTLFNFPITESWNFRCVLALHTSVSFIFSQPGRDRAVEDANKLAVDGMFIGRGWSGEFHNRGLTLWNNWVELRFPLVPGILALDLFFDAAGVETTHGYYFRPGNFTWENLRFSYGVGLRFTIPQFPFRFSLANRFRIEDGQVRWQHGMLGYRSDNPFRGLDPVISFVLSY